MIAVGVRLVDGFWRDLRLGTRALRATPVVSAVAVLSLALGIGANTAIFALIDSLLLRTLPVKDPSRLVLVTTTAPGVAGWSYPVWDHLRQLELFESAAAWSVSRFDLASRGETQFINGLWTNRFILRNVGCTRGDRAHVFGPGRPALRRPRWSRRGDQLQLLATAF